MDMSISLDDHFLQYHSYLILQDMFVEKRNIEFGRNTE